MSRGRTLLVLSLFSAACSAQWEVPTNIVLDGATDDQRQVTGLSLPLSTTSGANVASDRQASTTFGVATGTNALALTLVPAPSSLAPGMRITFTPSATNTSDASLAVNDLAPVPLRKNINMPLDSGDLRPGIPVQVIHDGVVFQIVSQLYPGCRSGYKPVGSQACVEEASHGPITWYAANVACMGQGARLCGFSEWIQACLQGDNIFGSVMDYEWVDEAANSNNDAKSMGVNEVTLAPDCRAGSTRAPLTNLRYRCCYDR